MTALSACSSATPGDPPSQGTPHQQPPSCPLGVDLLDAGFAPQGGALQGQLAGCRRVVFASAGAAGSTLEFGVETWASDAALEVTVMDVAGRVLLPTRALEGREAASFEIVFTGEFAIELSTREMADGEHPFSLTLGCRFGCDRPYTRYPIVLVHGLGGGQAVGDVDYFYRVRDDLDARGYVVYNPAVPPFADSTDRALSLHTDIDRVLMETRARKVNLIAHSQGGLDSRVLTSGLGYGDRVASIVTIGTPHRGTVVADVLTGAATFGGVSPAVIDAGAAAFAALYGRDGGDDSLIASLEYLRTSNLATFDAQYPDLPGVYYASWAGHTCGRLESGCQREHGGEVIDPMMEPLHAIMWLAGLEGDGLVPVESARHGDFMGEVDADHADEIGAFKDEDNPAFDHLDFYRREAARLGAMGL